MKPVRLDGRSLTRAGLVAVAHGAQVELATEQLPAVARAAEFLAEQVRREEPIYGVSTGFGADGKFRSFTRLRVAHETVNNVGTVLDRDRLGPGRHELGADQCGRAHAVLWILRAQRAVVLDRLVDLAQRKLLVTDRGSQPGLGSCVGQATAGRAEAHHRNDRQGGQVPETTTHAHSSILTSVTGAGR